MEGASKPKKKGCLSMQKPLKPTKAGVSEPKNSIELIVDQKPTQVNVDFKFDILDYLKKLTPWKKHKHKYHCPICDGPLPVSKSGKFFCVNHEGDKQHLREIRKALTGENFTPAYTPTREETFLPAPLPETFELALLPQPAQLATGNRIKYQYSLTQWVERINQPNGKKSILPYHLDQAGKVVCKVGDKPWPLYHQDEILKYAIGKFLLVVEGEKATDYTRSAGIVATTVQGSQWSVEKIEAYVKWLKSIGILGIGYHPDDDDPGYKKAAKWQDAANKYQLPYIELNPKKLNPNSNKGDDIADLIINNIFSLDSYLEECNRAFNEYKLKAVDAIFKAGKDAKSTNFDREISKDEWEYKQLLNLITKQSEQLHSQPSIQPSRQLSIQSNQPKKLDVDIWFNPEDRGKIYQQIATDEKYQKYKYILDNSTTGSGKTHHIGTLEPHNLKADKLFYISNEHRNPTTPTIEQNYVDLPARNDGLFADDNGKIHWPKDGQQPNITGNCSRAALFRKLASKGYQHEANSEASLNPICNGCKYKFNCSGHYPDGKEAAYIPGNSFRADRKNALLADRNRCHIDSLPSDIPGNSIAFVDEFSRQINRVQLTEVTLTDYQKTITQTATELQEVWELFKNFISPLHEYLSYSHKEPHYGYDHNEVMGIFGNINKADIPQIINQLKSLNPDLETFFEKADSLDNYKGLSKSIIKTIKSGLSKAAFKESHDLLDDLANNWIIPLLEVYAGLVTGNFRIKNHKLIIATENTRQVESLAKFEKVFLLDATATRESVAKELGINPDEILVICENLPNSSNLEVVRITDLGLCGKNRSDSKNRQIEALINNLKPRYKKLKVGDHLSCKQDDQGYWFYDNRGSNDYVDCDAMLWIGTPYPDIGAIKQRYSILTGDFDTTKGNPNFQNYLNHLVQAEIIQAVGRPRANRRPSEKITVYLTTNTDISYLADYFPGCKITQTTAFELCPQAGNREQVSKYTLLEAFKVTIDKGIKCTQENLSRLSGLSQPYISKISKLYGGFEKLKKLLLTLINSLYRGSNNSSGLSEDEIFYVNSYLPLLANEAPENIPNREDKAAYLVRELTELVDIVGFDRFEELSRYLAPEVIGEFIKSILGIVPVPVGW